MQYAIFFKVMHLSCYLFYQLILISENDYLTAVTV